MSMPEAPVHKEHRAVFWKYEVRATGQPAIMKAISKPTCMQTSPYQKFRLGVLASDCSHVAAAGLPVVDVSQPSGPSPCRRTLAIALHEAA